MKAYYVDLVRGSRISLLAGPFRSEEIARKYVRPAVEAAMKIDPWAHFDQHGVMSIEENADGSLRQGKLNHMINIDPADILMSRAEWQRAKAQADARHEAMRKFDAEYLK